MVSFELGKAIEKKFFFRLVTSVGQRKNSESPRGIEPQTFALMLKPLSHRDSTMNVRLLFFQIIKTFRLILPSTLAIFYI